MKKDKGKGQTRGDKTPWWMYVAMAGAFFAALWFCGAVLDFGPFAQR